MKNLFIFTKEKASVMLFFVLAYITSSITGFLLGQSLLRASATSSIYVPVIASLLFFVLLYLGIYFVFTRSKLTKPRFSKKLSSALATLTIWLAFEILFEIFQLPLSQFSGEGSVLVPMLYLITIFIVAMYAAISFGIELSYPSNNKK